MIPRYNPNEEVVVKHKKGTYFYPSDSNPLYMMNPLARTSKMPLMKWFDIEILNRNLNITDKAFDTSLHTYAYNYGRERINMIWEFNEEQYSEVINSGDSFYMQPFIRHAFSNHDSGNGNLVVIGVSGAMNLSAQKELSYFSDLKRVARETRQWFN